MKRICVFRPKKSCGTEKKSMKINYQLEQWPSRGLGHKNRLHKQMQQLSMIFEPIIGSDELFLIKTLRSAELSTKTRGFVVAARGTSADVGLGCNCVFIYIKRSLLSCNWYSLQKTALFCRSHAPHVSFPTFLCSVYASDSFLLKKSVPGTIDNEKYEA